MFMIVIYRELIVLDMIVCDGSYVVNFQYIDDDVCRIVGDFDVVGIFYIEIGYGVIIGVVVVQGLVVYIGEEYFCVV